MNHWNPFPVYALPPGLRDAVLEVHANVKAPIEIAVASALGALSLACQDQFDVRRPNGLVSPCSLSLITMADSGDRKTSCDKLFMRSIKDVELDAELAAPGEHEKHEADLLVWTLQAKAIEKKLLKPQKKETQNAEIAAE